MKRPLAWLAALAAAGTALMMAAPAGAATLACTKGPTDSHCVGLESTQSTPLELTVTGGAGSVVTATTPRFTAAQDWDRPGADNHASHIEWAPRGHRSGLCLTATLDVKRAPVRLEPCVSGTAGSSHQLWLHHDNGPNYNFTNLANGLALAVAGDSSGALVEVRTPNFSSHAQIFACIGHSPTHTGP
jgi:hypothetical protein